jgi:hypothetical protein
MDVKKHLPNIVNTALGHLDATRKNIASTRPKRPTVVDYSRPAIWMCDTEVTARLHLDAAGALPFTGRDGSKYLIIFFRRPQLHPRCGRQVAVCLGVRESDEVGTTILRSAWRGHFGSQDGQRVFS